MSSSTNIALNSRSMNGIISISDGVAVLENGNLTCSNVNSNSLTLTGNTIGGLTSLTTSPTYPDATNQIATTAFVSNNFVDQTTNQTNIVGQKTFTTGLTTSNVTALSNKQIFFNLLTSGTVPIANSILGGLAIAFNQSTTFGETNLIGYGAGNNFTGGIELSYINQINSKVTVARFFYFIRFFKTLEIFGNTITNLSALNANPLSTDNNTNIATTSFVKAQSYLTTSTASTTYCDLSTAQVINGSKTFTSKTIFQDITHPTDFTYMSGQIYSEGVYLNIIAKKNNELTLSPSIIRFYVSSRFSIASDLAFTIQGNWSGGGSDPTTTQIIIGGALYSPTNYLGAVYISGGTILSGNSNSTSTSSGALTIQNGGLGVGLDIFCGGNLSIIGTTLLTGQLTISNSSITGLSQLSTLTYLPVFPDSTAKIASTAFVSTNFSDLTTTQTISGTKTFTDFNVDTITLTYTTTPIYLQQEIGYTIYANGINNTTIPATLTDVTGTSITITAGTWILEYNITIVPNSSLNYKIFVSGFSYSATSFTNVSGTGNSYFHNKASLTGQTITASYTINYSQIFYNSTGYKTIYLLALSSLNTGAGYYYNHNSSTFGVYDLPTSYIQATRIA